VTVGKLAASASEPSANRRTGSHHVRRRISVRGARVVAIRKANHPIAATTAANLIRVALHADLDLVAEPRRALVAELTNKKLRRGAHRSTRAERRHPGLDEHLERGPPALRLDQDRRPDPRIHHPLLHTN
jgi:hypothetical protein